MDSVTYFWITPTTCFSIACVAFSLVAASSVWKRQQDIPFTSLNRERVKQTIGARPQPRRRVAVDSLYAESGDAIYDKLAAACKHIDEAQTARPEDVLLDLINKSARLSQLVHQSRNLSRVTSTTLLSEIALLTTGLYRLQQLPKKTLSQNSPLIACFEATTRSLGSILEGLETDFTGCTDAASIDCSIQQLRDQRPALEFLFASLNSSFLPPSPPSETVLAADLEAADSSQSGLATPNIFQTGLTPATHSRTWIEPPPEYSPSADSVFGITLEQCDAKSGIPNPPEPQTAERTEEYDTDALYNAVTQNDVDLVNELLALGANPNEVIGDVQRTPLHNACHLNHVSCLIALLRGGAEISVEDNKGDKPIHLAAWAGHVEALRALHAHGADVDWLSGRDGYSPLWCAISAYHIDAARLLLKQGARVSQRSASGLTPLHQGAVTSQSAMCELLLERGAQVDALDDDNNSPLHYAAASGSAASVQILLRDGAQVDAKQVQGLTPLHWASHKGHAEVLAVLLTCCAPVDAQTEGGASPLHLAANRGHVSAVRALLHQGANRNLKAVWDGGEGTAADMAKAKGHERIVRMLQAGQSS